MIARKPVATSKNERTRSASKSDWRDTLRRRLAKLPEIDAIFVVRYGGSIDVNTVIAGHRSEIYESLMRQERLIEKDHPRVSFDFHTREHQGRPPSRAVPAGAEAVFVRK